MNPWKRLGIDPTREEKDIKRAYTRLLRQHPPETDPSGFQEVRTAYDSALFLSRLPADAIISLPPGSEEEFDGAALIPPAPVPFPPPTEADIPAQPPEPAHNPSEPLPHPAADAEPAWQKDAKALLDLIAKDFPDHVKRQYDYYWSGVLEAPVLWILDAKSWVGWNLFAFIGQQNLKWSRQPTEVHISKEAWIVLDDTFGWLEHESSLHATFPEDLTDSVLDPIRAARGLKTAADMIPPSVTTLIESQNRTNGFEGLARYIIPAVLLLIYLFRSCSS